MNEEDRRRITSNDFADLLIAYGGDVSIFNQFQDATVHIINPLLAVVHIPVSQITDNIIKERGYYVMPSLLGLISQASLEASGIIRIRNVPNFDLRGQGVLIGIVDSGIDYTNPVFQYANKTTKIVSIWDQTIETGNYPGNTLYGTEYTKEQINEALKNENPLTVVPTTDTVGHGTMIAGIAAGNEVPESGFYGVAPEAELVVVKLKQAKSYLKDFFRVPESTICYQENDYLFALEYIISVSYRLNRPLAVCVALGTSQAAHDGMGTTSSYLSQLAYQRGFAVVIAAGNEGSAKRHYYGEVDPTTGYDQVELNVGENEFGFSMELWGSSPNIYSIDILTPSGEYIPKITASLAENRVISFIFERTLINVDYQMVESESGDQLILIRFKDPAPGIWRFKVYAVGITPLSFHIWLPMTGFISENTYFIRSNPYTTILALGNARVPITVTAYNTEDNSLYQNSSRGYTRIEVVKPEIAAPGVGITSPNLNKSFSEVTGTSASAAHTAGVAALLLEWGIVRNNYPDMSTIDMKAFMIRGARRDPNLKYPNRDWGYGILDVFNVFDRIRSELP